MNGQVSKVKQVRYTSRCRTWKTDKVVNDLLCYFRKVKQSTVQNPLNVSGAWREHGALSIHPVRTVRAELKIQLAKKHSRGRNNSPAGKFMQAALMLAGQVKWRVVKSRSPTSKQREKLPHKITGDGHTEVFNTGNPTGSELTPRRGRRTPNSHKPQEAGTKLVAGNRRVSQKQARLATGYRSEVECCHVLNGSQMARNDWRAEMKVVVKQGVRLLAITDEQSCRYVSLTLREWGRVRELHSRLQTVNRLSSSCTVWQTSLVAKKRSVDWQDRERAFWIAYLQECFLSHSYVIFVQM